MIQFVCIFEYIFAYIYIHILIVQFIFLFNLLKKSQLKRINYVKFRSVSWTLAGSILRVNGYGFILRGKFGLKIKMALAQTIICICKFCKGK